MYESWSFQLLELGDGVFANLWSRILAGVRVETLLELRLFEIRIDPHTLEQALRRGVTLSEIEDVLKTGNSISAKSGRLAKYKVFDFDREWRGKRYRQKRVEVVYVVEERAMITVTVYGFFGSWPEER